MVIGSDNRHFQIATEVVGGQYVPVKFILSDHMASDRTKQLRVKLSNASVITEYFHI